MLKEVSTVCLSPYSHIFSQISQIEAFDIQTALIEIDTIRQIFSPAKEAPMAEDIPSEQGLPLNIKATHKSDG